MRNIVLLAFLFFGIYANAQDINAAIEEFNQGNQALQSENLPLAIQKYKTSLDMATALGEEGLELVAAAKKQIPTLYYQIGIQNYKEKNNEKAIIELQNAIKYGEEYGEQDMVDKSKDLIPKLHFARGNDLFKDDKFDEALAAYSEAIELDPRYSKPYWGQALTYQKQRKSDEMVAAFKTSREMSIAENDEAFVERINSTAKRLLQSEGTGYLKSQKWNDAIKCFTTSNDFKADDPDTYYYLALSYNGLKNWNMAIEAAQTGVDLSEGESKDNKAKFYFEMGNAFKGANNNEKACEAYNNAKYGQFVENANYEITQVLKCN